jgi:hypothetical protein
MSDDEKQPAPLSSSDFHKFMESFKTSIGETIHTAIAPLQTMQKEIIDDLKKTKDRVTAIEEDNDSTKVNVAELQKQMNSLQQNLLTRPTPNPRADYANVVRQTAPPPPPPASGPCPEAVQVLRDARMVVGFSPIRFDDINYLKRQHSIEDDATAMRIAIIEFLTLEMKVPKSFTDTLVLKRVFPPAKPPPSGWSTLYAEFPDITSADLIHQYVRNLLPGKTVTIYVPHSLHPRFSAICDIAHEYRNGAIKHKTKIKYGASDFVLIVKPKNSNSPWSHVPLNLPPLELSSFDGNPSTSPPPGRTRLTSKRDRSESPNSGNDIRTNKSRKDDSPDDTPVSSDGTTEESTETEVLQPEDQATETQNQPKSPVPVNKDLGLFQPSACASPSFTGNKNFTFNLAQSNIPKMKNHLN